MKMSSSPLVYIIVLNWNNPDDTIECLASLELLHTENIVIVVVDNGSTDGSIRLIKTEFPEVMLIETKQNLGFAGGMNVGVCHALEQNAEFVLLLNNDTVAHANMLNHMLEHADDDIGLIAPVIFYFDEPSRVWSSGGGFNEWTLEMTGGHGRNQFLPDSAIERGFLSGCAWLISRNTFENVGLLDERFFMYYEDLDFCLRVREAGYRLILVPKAHLWHKVSQSTGGEINPTERYYMALSSVMYFRKHMRGVQILLIPLYRFLSALRWTLKLITKQEWTSLAAYWRGLFMGWSAKRRQASSLSMLGKMPDIQDAIPKKG